MYKIKRNGFTLVELMAVIIIISLIALLTFPNIINQIKKTKKSNNKMIEDVVIEQAKKYVSDNPDEFQDDDGYCLSIDTLVDKGYVNEQLVGINNKDNDVIMMIKKGDFSYKIVNKNDCDVSEYQNIFVDNEGKKYERVEYLESTGTQYIDTEYYNNPNTKVDITFMYLKSNGDAYSNGMIYGSANSYDGRPSYSIGLTTENKIYYRNSNSAESFTNYSISSNQKINVITDKTSITIDGNTYQHNMSLITNNAPYSSYIFARHQPTDSNIVHVNDAYVPLIGRIYSCKIYDGDEMVRDYVPVVDQDHTPCLFDKINKKCYYNKGSGDFFTQYISKKIEYLEGTGTQYIDTEYYNNPNTKVDITFMYLKSNGDAYSNGMIYGSADYNNGRPSYSIGLTTENKIYYRNSNSAESFTNYSISSNQKINVITDKTSITIDGNTYQHNMSLITNNAPYSSYIFARHQPTDSYIVHVNDAYVPLIGRIYSCKIYDGDKLVRDYIPMLDKNGVPCLYEKIEGKFYYNKGTGEFLYG